MAGVAPAPPPGATFPRIIEYPAGRIEILNEGDEAGQGLVRTCVFNVPRYLLSGGKARSWETVTEARVNELSRYVAIAKPLWPAPRATTASSNSQTAQPV